MICRFQQSFLNHKDFCLQDGIHACVGSARSGRIGSGHPRQDGGTLWIFHELREREGPQPHVQHVSRARYFPCCISESISRLLLFQFTTLSSIRTPFSPTTTPPPPSPCCLATPLREHFCLRDHSNEIAEPLPLRRDRLPHTSNQSWVDCQLDRLGNPADARWMFPLHSLFPRLIRHMRAGTGLRRTLLWISTHCQSPRSSVSLSCYSLKCVGRNHGESNFT